ncbi:Uromodulin [Stylophora pistillata]|uniref:Uromodulin n=1 Tax=Stylophora pistillata TaxID=50429 RepID=A0A2B4RMM4_STYPI|nr:Uromodulin [Stylophora pistillata]
MPSAHEPCVTKVFVEPVSNKALANHLISRATVESPDACMIQCFIKIKCESYNIGPREKDGHVCELSDSDSHRDHMDWITKEGFSYVETLNPCRQAQCPLNGRCYSNFENNTHAYIDECKKNLHSCHSNAFCNNTNGSYSCICKTGFQGDGKETCHGKFNQSYSSNGNAFNISRSKNIDECIEGIHGCHNNASCTNTNGTYRCTCKPGFAGDGRNSCQVSPGWFSYYPAHSCKHIRDSGDHRGDGEYWIDPEKSGKPLKVHCDMTTDKGGWLLVTNIVTHDSSRDTQFSEETSYRGIDRDNASEDFSLTTNAMKKLKAHMPFTQMRFHCRKQRNRIFHVTTVANSTGEAVVQYFSGETNVLPKACGSFVRMADDNSSLAAICQQWGQENQLNYVGKWSWDLLTTAESKLYNHAAFVRGSYHWIASPRYKRWECDDFSSSVSIGDFWKVFVR